MGSLCPLLACGAPDARGFGVPDEAPRTSDSIAAPHFVTTVPALSPDGGTLGFLGREGHGEWRVFVNRDPGAHALSGRSHPSLIELGTPPPGWESIPYPLAVSNDGRWVILTVGARDPYGSALAAVDTSRSPTDDRAFTLLTRTPEGTTAGGHSQLPAVSSDGRFVAFMSDADDLVPGDSNGCDDIFVLDRDPTGSGTFDGTVSTTRVSVSTDGVEANDRSGELFGLIGPSMSADGNLVAFVTHATNLDDQDRGGLFVHDRRAGWTRRVPYDGAGCNAMQMSAGGGHLAFTVLFLEPGSGIPQYTSQVYVLDLATWTSKLVSDDPEGKPGSRSSSYPSISPDGRYVAFLTDSRNLTEGLRTFAVVDRGASDPRTVHRLVVPAERLPARPYLTLRIQTLPDGVRAVGVATPVEGLGLKAGIPEVTLLDL